jgi:hypothetical protein
VEAKEAISYLRNNQAEQAGLLSSGVIPKSSKALQEIAALIERLEKEAELGRLAIDIVNKLPCNGYFNSVTCKQVHEISFNKSCHLSDFCRQRAEMEAGQGE